MGVAGASSTIVVQVCHGFGRERVVHVNRSPQGESWRGLSASRVTSDRGCQAPSAATGDGRSMGPCRGWSGTSPASVTSDMTFGGHSRMQMPQPMHSPTWSGRSMVHGSGKPGPGPVSMPAACGRLISSASTGHTSMHTPHVMHPRWSMSMR